MGSSYIGVIYISARAFLYSFSPINKTCRARVNPSKSRSCSDFTSCPLCFRNNRIPTLPTIVHRRTPHPYPKAITQRPALAVFHRPSRMPPQRRLLPPATRRHQQHTSSTRRPLRRRRRRRTAAATSRRRRSRDGSYSRLAQSPAKAFKRASKRCTR